MLRAGEQDASMTYSFQSSVSTEKFSGMVSVKCCSLSSRNFRFSIWSKSSLMPLAYCLRRSSSLSVCSAMSTPSSRCLPRETASAGKSPSASANFRIESEGRHMFRSKMCSRDNTMESWYNNSTVYCLISSDISSISYLAYRIGATECRGR